MRDSRSRRVAGWRATAAGSMAVGLMALGCATAIPLDPIPGSRPGLMDDPDVVVPASLQAELGVDAGRFAGEDFRAGELLLRYGISGAIEARLGVESYGARSDGAPAHALGDPEVGLKIGLAREAEGLTAPALALIPTVTLPVGADRLTAGGAEAALLLVAGWEGPGFDWTTNLGTASARSEAGRHLEVFTGLAIGRAVTERVDVELELVGTMSRGGNVEDPGLRHAALGAAWLVHPDLQLDAWAGVQREGGARGRFVGVGLSARR